MELTKKQIAATKGVAILFMLLLHLFCTKTYIGLFEPTIFIGKYPLIYYLALFGDCCVAIYCFCSGYGLMYNYINNPNQYSSKNKKRVFKLYLKYWIIIFIFVIIIGLTLRKPGYPGDLKNLLLTLSGINPGYNGAWWFFTTYLLLIIFSKNLNKLILKYDIKLVIFMSLIFYIIGYIQRIKVPIILNNIYGDYFLKHLALFGSSQFPVIVGGIFQKEKTYSKLKKVSDNLRYKNCVLYSIIIALLILHGFIETLFVGTFIGLIFIPIFNLLDKKVYVDIFFQYIGKHSTNLWLIHMFFYMIYFKNIVYYPKYPILIFIWLVLLCLPFSYLIDWIENKLLKN